MLTLGVVLGIFAAELDINKKCAGRGVYDSMFFYDVRCAPIQKVQTLEEAKALIDGYHAKAGVRG